MRNLLMEVGDDDKVRRFVITVTVFYFIYMFFVGFIGPAVYIKHNNDLRIHLLMSATQLTEYILEYIVGGTIVVSLVCAFFYDLYSDENEHMLLSVMFIIVIMLFLSVVFQRIGLAVGKNILLLIVIGVALVAIGSSSIMVVSASTFNIIFSGPIGLTAPFAALMATVIPYILTVFGIGIIADVVMSFF